MEGGFIQLAYFCGGILSNVMLNWSNNDLLPLNIKEVMLLKLVGSQADEISSCRLELFHVIKDLFFIC